MCSASTGAGSARLTFTRSSHRGSGHEVPDRPESVGVEVLIDTCSIEVFAAGGLVAISDLVFF